jgi:hypothetical protein
MKTYALALGGLGVLLTLGDARTAAQSLGTIRAHYRQLAPGLVYQAIVD